MGLQMFVRILESDPILHMCYGILLCHFEETLIQGIKAERVPEFIENKSHAALIGLKEMIRNLIDTIPEYDIAECFGLIV